MAPSQRTAPGMAVPGGGRHRRATEGTYDSPAPRAVAAIYDKRAPLRGITMPLALVEAHQDNREGVAAEHAGAHVTGEPRVTRGRYGIREAVAELRQVRDWLQEVLPEAELIRDENGQLVVDLIRLTVSYGRALSALGSLYIADDLLEGRRGGR